MNHQDILDDLDRRREKARAMGGPEKLQKRKESGQLNAWERLECLIDENSFFETGLLGTSTLAATGAALRSAAPVGARIAANIATENSTTPSHLLATTKLLLPLGRITVEKLPEREIRSNDL